MATIKEITSMCKEGRVKEAYSLASEDYERAPNDPWVQREVGWALYYLIKEDAEEGRLEDFYSHLEELKNLDRLDSSADSMIFDSILWKASEVLKKLPADAFEEIGKFFSVVEEFNFPPSKPLSFIYEHLPWKEADYVKGLAPDDFQKLDQLFSFLKTRDFTSSRGYSILLSRTLKFKGWSGLGEFIEWWNLDKLLPEDYEEFKTQEGKNVMSLAERSYIAMSRALLSENNPEKIEAFIPKLERLMERYPNMAYPGYFCGKLLTAAGSQNENALKKVLPFVRKKKSEFWVWQLLSEICSENRDTKLACLLRAVHCKTKETFIGKVRTSLAQLYVEERDYPRAKYQIDCVTRCYLTEGWPLPVYIKTILHEEWINTTKGDPSDPIDYSSITDRILYGDLPEVEAVVVYIDVQSQRASLIYGKEKRAVARLSDLGVKVKAGNILRIKYAVEGEKLKVMGGSLIKETTPSMDSYCRKVEGVVKKMDANPFAFLSCQGKDCFISPAIVGKLSLADKDRIEALIVYDYNKKKEKWGWAVLTAEKK